MRTATDWVLRRLVPVDQQGPVDRRTGRPNRETGGQIAQPQTPAVAAVLQFPPVVAVLTAATAPAGQQPRLEQLLAPFMAGR